MARARVMDSRRFDARRCASFLRFVRNAACAVRIASEAADAMELACVFLCHRLPVGHSRQAPMSCRPAHRSKATTRVAAHDAMRKRQQQHAAAATADRSLGRTDGWTDGWHGAGPEFVRRYDRKPDNSHAWRRNTAPLPYSFLRPGRLPATREHTPKAQPANHTRLSLRLKQWRPRKIEMQ